ncbi:MAG: hypothetical protein SLAVMIC_00733 [uncultured marine phage]|uniref:Uncharacterized protein n=1 Tax=uncultured marine phage TaxID=707152 RepID=A0A8D9FQG8_9VIRU|nr:MAG: hypothetical protein SLAVMIC_00733 [uncultured marine phage]
MNKWEERNTLDFKIGETFRLKDDYLERNNLLSKIPSWYKENTEYDVIGYLGKHGVVGRDIESIGEGYFKTIDVLFISKAWIRDQRFKKLLNG